MLTTQEEEDEEAQAEEAVLNAIRYLVSECNYGGCVTDLFDRRLLKSLLMRLFNRGVANETGYHLSETGFYKVPEDVSRSHVLAAIEAMPHVPLPEGLGLNENAAIIRDGSDSDEVIKKSLSSCLLVFLPLLLHTRYLPLL